MAAPGSSAPRLSVKEAVRILIGRVLMRWGRKFLPWAQPPPLVIDGLSLDVDAQWLLEVARRARPALLHRLPVAQARRQEELSQRVVGGVAPAMAQITDYEIPGPGGMLPARLYVPSQSQQPSAGLVYFHGGGGVLGSIRSFDTISRVLARESGIRVLSVEYRLAPEHPHPAAMEDGLVAFRWAVEQGRALGMEPGRVAVGGDSYGGRIAAVVCHRTLDEGGPPPCYQLLIYPSLDMSDSSRSRELFANGLLLTQEMTNWFSSHFLAGASITDVSLSPVRRESLVGLPPAQLEIAGLDMLRDPALEYASRLRDAGVLVRLRRHDTLLHGFIQITGVVPAARRSLEAIGRTLGQGISGLAEAADPTVFEEGFAGSVVDDLDS